MEGQWNENFVRETSEASQVDQKKMTELVLLLLT